MTMISARVFPALTPITANNIISTSLSTKLSFPQRCCFNYSIGEN
jgi:hypothetical protein